MPDALPYIIEAAKQIAIAAAQAAISYGVNELLGANDAPDPASQKVPIKQPIPPVQYAYGAGRLSGSFLYWRTVGNVTLDVIALCQGPVQSIDGFYLNDDAVVMDGDIVEMGADGRYRRAGAENDTIRILSRLGETPSAHYAEVGAASGGEWTEDHRADGVSTMAIIAKGVKTDIVQIIYPNGPVQGSAVGHWSKCYDWRADSTMPGGDGPQRRDDPSTWEWTHNAVVCHVHNEWFVYGQDFDYRFLPTLAQLTVAADVCDEQVPLKAGGFIDRYRVFGAFNSRTPPKQVRQLFASCYDGIWIERGDGAFVVIAGKYVAPTVVLDEDRIRRFRWRKVRRQEDVCNSLVVAFNSPDHDYTVVETQRWQDAASVAALGEYPQPFERKWVDNNSQARRLAKAAFARLNAEYDGFVEIDLSDDEEELEQAYFTIRNRAAPASMWDVDVQVTSMTLDLVNRLVRIEFIKADPTAYDWDAETEEGDGPGVAPAPVPQITEVPVIETAEVFFSGTLPRLNITVEHPLREDYGILLRWRVVGETAWTMEFPDPAEVTGPSLQFQSSVLPNDAEIEFGVAFVPGQGAPGDFADYPSPISTVQALGAPTDLLAFDMETSPSAASVSWRNPVQAFGWVVVSRNTVDDFGTAVPVDYPQVGGLGAIMEIEDLVPADEYFYWVQAFAADSSPGGVAGPAVVTVT